LYQTELFLGSDSLFVKLANTGNIVINSDDNAGNTAQWKFGIDGNLTASGNLIIAGNTNVFGTDSALIQPTNDKPLIALSSGANGAVSSLWVEDIGNVGTSNIAAVYANPTVGSGIVRIAVGQNGGNAGPNLWDFNASGALTLPNGAVIKDNAGNSVAFGKNAGSNAQGVYSVAIGWGAGEVTQGGGAVAVGINAGGGAQGNVATAIGYGAGQTTQGVSAVAIGESAGSNTQGNFTVAIGTSAGQDTQGVEAVAIGSYAGADTQGLAAVAIGLNAGQFSQGTWAVAVGQYAGNSSQGLYAVAVGTTAGTITQGTAAVAVGDNAGANAQGIQSVAIGQNAGTTTQGNTAVAIGAGAAAGSQGTNAVAIGTGAGYISQGANSIAIGKDAGFGNQGTNSIVLNATGAQLNQTVANTFTVAPVRNDVSNIAEVMFYNATSKEVTYGNTISVAGNVTANNFIGNGGGLSNVATKTTGSWTLAAGTNTVNISVPLNGTYSIWINGNIPNGIITYTATAVITNTNVPVLGSQYAWYYAVGNALVFTSIPNQFTGTVGSISNFNTYLGNTANVFTFGITNNSGTSQVVNYGYTKL
jgi:hypothetical protein